MTKIAVMQPYLFPYLGYFQLIKNVDKFVFFDNVNFKKKGWINRNFLRNNQGSMMFSMSVKKTSQNKLINQLHISDISAFENALQKKISHNYSKSNYYQYVRDILFDIFRKFDGNTVSDFNIFSTTRLANELGISTQFVISSNLVFDLNGNGQEKILSICKAIGADNYLNLPGGVNLYDNQKFTKNEIKLGFLDVDLYPYEQGYKDFIPGLSIIDYLCHCGPTTWIKNNE